jgi:hypothetical protein
MKIVIFITIASFLCCFNSYSQSDFSFGPKLGFNVGSPLPIGNVPKGAKGTPIAGHNLGLFCNYSINKHWSFTIETVYTRKGAEFTSPIDSMPYSDRQEFMLPDSSIIVFNVETFFNGKFEGVFDNYYFEIPFLFNYHFKNPKWSLCFGGYYAWLTENHTNARAIGTAGYDPRVHDEYVEFAENTRKHDWGFMAGGQYTFKNKISINLRLSYGMESVLLDSFDKVPYSLNNSFAQLAATYSFFPDSWEKKSK